MAKNKKNSKVKNLIITLVEILVVAGIIFGAITFVVNKMDSDADVANTNKIEEHTTGNYYLEVNIAKNSMIVYELDEDNNKKAIKVFAASVGNDLTKGKYSIEEKHAWVRIGDDWSQYGSKIDSLCYIGSSPYSDNYPETLKRKAYDNIGVKKSRGKSILLYAGDANWIFENCKVGTDIKVVNGAETDQLPMQAKAKTELSAFCDWDPTDPNENNPYLKAKNGSITVGNEIIYVEKDSKIDYLANLLVLDSEGADITDQLVFEKIKTNELGSKTINYSITTLDGKTLTTTQNVEIIDTTCPVVTCSRDYFTYQVKGRGTANLNTDSNVKAIESMVRNYVSVNESDCTITVKTIVAKHLMEGEVPVVIKAQDPSGNIGSYQVVCNITVKGAVITDKNTPSEIIEELEEQRKKDKKDKKKDAKEE